MANFKILTDNSGAPYLERDMGIATIIITEPTLEYQQVSFNNAPTTYEYQELSGWINTPTTYEYQEISGFVSSPTTYEYQEISF